MLLSMQSGGALAFMNAQQVVLIDGLLLPVRLPSVVCMPFAHCQWQA